MTKYFSYKFIALLTLLSIIFTATNATSALPPIWLLEAQRKCNPDDKICMENIRDSFFKEEEQFIKENPNKTDIDFTIKKCIENDSLPEHCIDRHTRNYIYLLNENPNKGLTDTAIRNCIEFKVFSTREQCIDWEKQRFGGKQRFLEKSPTNSR